MRTFRAFLLLGLATSLPAQQTPTANTATTTTISSVPRFVRVKGTFKPADGQPPAATEGVTLAIYRDERGGAPLWQETQNVTVDSEGHYNALLGSTQDGGVPVELFTSGEPRWLGVQFQRPGEPEQARVLMASVPYALKAVDAETLGGLPASAYMLSPSAPPSVVTASGGTLAGNLKPGKLSPKAEFGTAGFLSVFVDSSDVSNSALFQNGAKIGLGTTSPADYFHVAFNDTSGGVTGYAVQNLGSGAASYSGMLFYDQNGALGQFQGFNNVSHEYRINNIASGGSINFMLGSASKLQIQSSGNIDIAGNVSKNGTPFLQGSDTSTALGINAFSNNTNGGDDTAVGSYAMAANTTGYHNTATGYQALLNNTTGSENTGNGVNALAHNTTASSNTATGFDAMFSNTTGQENTATGSYALAANITGSDNTANGFQAMISNTTGGVNTATGTYALQANTTGGGNAAYGGAALYSNTTGTGNTAVGDSALSSLGTGSNNIGIGGGAGDQLPSDGHDNIMIGNNGSNTDYQTIRLGVLQARTYVAGIYGVTTTNFNAAPVLVDNTGQLGTINSSRRFKEDIQDMGDASTKLMQLRPVTYRYKQPYADGSKPIDYGLIAEEVEDVYPDLVAKNKDGDIQTVQYQKLTPMMLNELQKQNQHIQQQDETISLLQEEIAELKKAMKVNGDKSGEGPAR